MQWVERQERRYVARSAEVERIDCSTAREMFEGLAEILPKQRRPWDYVRVEYWDGGRWLIFPALSTSVDRVDDVGCEVVSEDDAVEQQKIDDLLGDDYENEFEFERAFDAFLRSAVRAVLAGVDGVVDVPVRAFYASEPDVVEEA